MNITRRPRTARPHTRLGLSGLLAAVAAATTLGFASPSQASNNSCVNSNITFSNAGFSIRIGNSGGHRVNVKQREFERGLAEGRCDGARDGFRDGLEGKRFDNDPRVRFRNASCEFIEGYKAGYAKTYCNAFEDGKQARCDSRRDHHGKRNDHRWR